MNQHQPKKPENASKKEPARHISMELTADGARVTRLSLDGSRLLLTIEAELSNSQLKATGDSEGNEEAVQPRQDAFESLGMMPSFSEAPPRPAAEAPIPLTIPSPPAKEARPEASLDPWGAAEPARSLKKPTSRYEGGSISFGPASKSSLAEPETTPDQAASIPGPSPEKPPLASDDNVDTAPPSAPIAISAEAQAAKPALDEPLPEDAGPEHVLKLKPRTSTRVKSKIDNAPLPFKLAGEPEVHSEPPPLPPTEPKPYVPEAKTISFGPIPSSHDPWAPAEENLLEPVGTRETEKLQEEPPIATEPIGAPGFEEAPPPISLNADWSSPITESTPAPEAGPPELEEAEAPKPADIPNPFGPIFQKEEEVKTPDLILSQADSDPFLATPTQGKTIPLAASPDTNLGWSEESSIVGGDRHGEPQPSMSFGFESPDPAMTAPPPPPAMAIPPSPSLSEPPATPAPEAAENDGKAKTSPAKKEAGSTTVLIRYTCPRCKTQGMQAVDKVGTVVNCSNCGKAMRLVMKK